MISSTGASLVSRSPRSERADTTLRGGRLVGRVEPVARLSDAERDALYGLLARYFDGATRPQFERDLAEKEWALLRGECRKGGVRITGYATQAARYCAITGGRYQSTREETATAEEGGICTFANGRQCDVHEYFAGECSRG